MNTIVKYFVISVFCIMCSFFINYRIVYCEETLKNLNQMASQGNAEAEYKLGMMYLTGDNVPVSKQKAIELIRKSSWKGNTQAKVLVAASYALPELFDLKIGKQDLPACQYLLKDAYDQGNKFATKILAYAYLFGIPGLEKSKGIANNLFYILGISEKDYKNLPQGITFNQIFKREVEQEYGITIGNSKVMHHDNS